MGSDSILGDVGCGDGRVLMAAGLLDKLAGPVFKGGIGTELSKLQLRGAIINVNTVQHDRRTPTRCRKFPVALVHVNVQHMGTLGPTTHLYGFFDSAEFIEHAARAMAASPKLRFAAVVLVHPQEAYRVGILSKDLALNSDVNEFGVAMAGSTFCHHCVCFPMTPERRAAMTRCAADNLEEGKSRASSSSRAPPAVEAEEGRSWEETVIMSLDCRAFADKEHAAFVTTLDAQGGLQAVHFKKGQTEVVKRPFSRFQAGMANSLAVQEGKGDSFADSLDAEGDGDAAAGGGGTVAAKAPAKAKKRTAPRAALLTSVPELQTAIQALQKRHRSAEQVSLKRKAAVETLTGVNAGLRKHLKFAQRALAEAQAAAEPEAEEEPGWFARPGGTDPNGGAAALFLQWGVVRRHTRVSSWNLVKEAMAAAKVELLDVDVGHSGCCKAYALVLLLRFGSHGGPKPTSAEVYKHVGELRALLPAALDDAELARLRSNSNANRSGYLASKNLEDAKLRVAVPYTTGLVTGNSMSGIWCEEFETSVGLPGNVASIEFHSACESNWYRSHVQVVLPKGTAPPLVGQPLALGEDMEVVFVRRIACHYHAVYINGRARTPVRDLPAALRVFLGI